MGSSKGEMRDLDKGLLHRKHDTETSTRNLEEKEGGKMYDDGLLQWKHKSKGKMKDFWETDFE